MNQQFKSIKLQIEIFCRKQSNWVIKKKILIPFLNAILTIEVLKMEEQKK